MPLPHKRRLRALALVLVLSLTSACSLVSDAVSVDKPPPKVGLKGYALDIAYGEDEPAPAVGPPPLVEGVGLFVEQPAPDIVIEEGDIEVGPRPSRPVPPPTDPCPPPGPDAVAEKPITSDVTAPVEAGTYLFRQAGTIQVAGLFDVVLPPLTTRVVRNVAQQANGTTDFEVELFNGVRRQIQRFRVVPDDGIYLSGMRTMVQQETREFNPLLPVKVFPLPAVELTPVSGFGLDPITGETLVVNGTVQRKQEVQGCDEVVHGWLTQGHWTFQRGTESQDYDLEYTVATQHGGLIIADHLKTIDRVGSFTAVVDITSAIGSIHPRKGAS